MRVLRTPSTTLPFSRAATRSTPETHRYYNRASMTLELSDSDLVDLEAPLTPPPSMNPKRRAESPHPDESSSKRVLTEDLYTGADAEDSDDEFVDAEEEITRDYDDPNGPHSSAAFGFEDLVNVDDQNGVNEQTDLAQSQTDGFSGDQFEQYGYGAQDSNDFSDILGPHGYGNGLTAEEIEAEGITAEQHLEFTNGFVEHDEQQMEAIPNELPARETWNQMSAAEQDEFLNQASSAIEDEPMFTTHTQDDRNGATFFRSNLDDQFQPDGLPAEQYECEAMDEDGEEDDAQLGAQQDPLDDDNLFSTTFGGHTEILSDDEEDQIRQQPQEINEPAEQATQPPSNRAGKPTEPTQSKTSHSNKDIIDLTETNDKAVVDFLNASKWHYDPTSTSTTTFPSSPPTSAAASQTTNGVNKTSASTSTQRIADLSRLNTNSPTLPRDLSKSLRAFQKFHTRVLHLIPHLPNWSSLPARRYWIAVLHLEKKPSSSSLSEKDFLWMKGNRFSTVSTIWNSYQTRVMCDPEDFVLVARGEVMPMNTKAEEMDWFGEKLVVLRAMRKGEARENVANVKGLMGGFGSVPEKMMGEVIELD